MPDVDSGVDDRDPDPRARIARSHLCPRLRNVVQRQGVVQQQVKQALRVDRTHAGNGREPGCLIVRNPHHQSAIDVLHRGGNLAAGVLDGRGYRSLLGADARTMFFGGRRVQREPSRCPGRGPHHAGGDGFARKLDDIAAGNGARGK